MIRLDAHAAFVDLADVRLRFHIAALGRLHPDAQRRGEISAIVCDVFAAADGAFRRRRANRAALRKER